MYFRYIFFRRRSRSGMTKQKTPRGFPRGAELQFWRNRSAFRAHAHHEGVEAELGDLPPQIFVVSEGGHAVEHLFEVGVLGADVLVGLLRGLVARLHYRLRERTKLRAA